MWDWITDTLGSLGGDLADFISDVADFVGIDAQSWFSDTSTAGSSNFADTIFNFGGGSEFSDKITEIGSSVTAPDDYDFSSAFDFSDVTERNIGTELADTFTESVSDIIDWDDLMNVEDVYKAAMSDESAISSDKDMEKSWWDAAKDWAKSDIGMKTLFSAGVGAIGGYMKNEALKENRKKDLEDEKEILKKKYALKEAYKIRAPLSSAKAIIRPEVLYPQGQVVTSSVPNAVVPVLKLNDPTKEAENAI